MSDLISRSAVIQAMKECYLDEQLFEKDVFDKIKAIPAAYDVNAVKKEIKELSIREFGEIRTEDVLDIVGKGGV